MRLRDGQTSASHNHRCAYIGRDVWRISWVVDRQYGRVRFPRSYYVNTTIAGARRFCRKWNLNPPNWPNANDVPPSYT